MTDVRIDVIVEDSDPAAVAAVNSAFAGLAPTTLDPTREILTIITVTTAAVTLTQKLVDLWKSTHEGAAAPAKPNITVEVASGATLVLGEVTAPEQIEQFVARHAAG